MTDRETLLAGIVAHPADRVRQMVFADWLDEHGEHSLAAKVREYDGLICVACGESGVCGDPQKIAKKCWACHGDGWVHRCQHEACGNEGLTCLGLWAPESDAGDPEEPDYFCRDHAGNHGYCPRCLYMHAGVDEYCDDCLADIAREEAEDEGWEDAEHEFDDYP